MPSRSTCPVDHQSVLRSSNIETWLSWQRVSIEDYTSGKSYERRRCPACGREFKRQIVISAVVYPVEVSLVQPLVSPFEPQSHTLSIDKHWPTDPAAFARTLRQRREAAGLTRVQLGALCGIADSTIRNIETARHQPTRNILRKILAVPQLQRVIAQELATEPPAPLLAEVQP